MRAAEAATSRFRCDYCRADSADVRRMEGEASPGSQAKEKKDSNITVARFQCPRKMPVRATILFPISGPNPTVPSLGTKPIPDAPVRLQPLKIKLLLVQNFALNPKP